MPKSKTHQKRKMKKRKRQEKFNSLIDKRLSTFKALPEEDQIALLTRWKNHGKNAADDKEGEKE